MAGDSLRSDVLPALNAGAWAAFVPHAIQWTHEQAEEPDSHPRYKRLTSLAELPSWIDDIG
jgi:putative hydrolase of the HAD superfamily